MITFFACPKPFEGHIAVIQRNAIRSWTLLRPEPEIMLLGSDRGIAETCAELGLIHVAEVDRNEYDTPLVDSIFRIAQERATCPIVCYVNSDIMLRSDFAAAVQAVAAAMPRFLVLGQRTDIDIQEAWDFAAPDWEAQLKDRLAREGTLHAPTGIDYFCFPRGMYTRIPPFAIGRLAWDNWLVWWARTQGVPVVDITEAVTVAHQNHGYAPGTLRKVVAQAGSPHSGAHERRFRGEPYELGPEARRNLALVPEDQNLNIWAATWMLDRRGRLLRRGLSPEPAYLAYQLRAVVPLYHRRWGSVLRMLVAVARALRARPRRPLLRTPRHVP